MSESADSARRKAPRDFELSRRSLVAAGALLVTVASTRAAEAFASSSRRNAGFRPIPPGNGNSFTAGGSGSPEITADPNCFLRGTRLLTPAGEVAIEGLAIGDMVVTHDGSARAIRWIGRRSLRRDSAGWGESTWPVRIAKDALAPGCPQRDLYVSRSHLLYLNGVLVAAGDLLNGATLVTVEPDADVIDYFHVELDRHDVVVAEGAPCDSLLPMAELRRSFDNYDQYLALYGEEAATSAEPCAPLAVFNGGRSKLKSRMRSALAPIVDIRHPLDIVRDDVEARAFRLDAA